MSKTITISELQESLNLARSDGLSWRKIAARFGVNVYYVYSLAVHGKEPRGQRIRRIFGLPLICQSCKQRAPRPRPIPPPWVTEAADNLQQLFNQKEQSNDAQSIEGCTKIKM